MIDEDNFEKTSSVTLGGAEEVPQTGPEAIMYALKHTSIDDLEEKARKDLKEGKKTKRAGAVALLHIVQGMHRNNQKPEDYMISAVPVVPPTYRPFAAQGGSFIPGDANILYKDLFDVLGAYNEERKMFGDDLAGESRLALYDQIKSVYGYGDPVKPKTKAKDVKGFLQKITGTTSKFGYVNRKLLSKTQDNTGRSTIIVEPDYGIDDIGIPEAMAFKMYAPYIQRRLKMMGMRDAQALKATVDRSEDARRALEEEMKVRPVVYVRAPAWHSLSFLAAKPKLISGSAIKTNPYVAAGLAADYDGNCVIGSTKLRLKLQLRSKSALGPAVTYDYDKKSIEIVLDNSNERVYISPDMNNTTLIRKSGSSAIIEMCIKDIPYLENTERVDKNGAFVYDVPSGIEVLTATPTGGVRWEEIKTFTKEEGCTLKKVTTSRNKEVICSENESLAAFDPKTGGLQRIRPEDAIQYKTNKKGERVVAFEHAVPVVTKYPNETSSEKDTDFEEGWLVGTFASDGTSDGKLITFTKASHEVRSHFLDVLCKLSGDSSIKDYATLYEDMHEADTNYGIGGVSRKIHLACSLLPDSINNLLSDCYNQAKKKKCIESGERSCLAKKLPDGFELKSEKYLLGILNGLIDGDGCMSLNKSSARSKPQFLCTFCTSSEDLRDCISTLCKLLGVTYTASVTRPGPNRVQTHDNYGFYFSSEWCSSNIDKFNLVTKYEALEYLRSNPSSCAATNVTPVSYYALQKIKEFHPEVTKEISAWDTNLCKAKIGGYALFCRDTSKKYADYIVKYVTNWESDPALLSVVVLANDTSISWERYRTVEDAPTETVYDLGVPEARVFALASGLVVYDTINVHVPASEAAVKEAYDVMMPSKTPFSNRDSSKIIPLPKQEQVLGLYTSATAPETAPIDFPDEASALKAIRTGKIPLSANITINGNPN